MNVEPDEAQLRVWRSFLETHSTLIRALEKEMQADQGLPLTWYDVLVHLSEASGGRLRHQALAKSLLLSRSGITRLVDRMATAGLVRREPCPDDRRGSYAVLTEEGRRALERAAPGHMRGITEHFAVHLNAEDVWTLGSVFDRVLRAKRDTRTDKYPEHDKAST